MTEKSEQTPDSKKPPQKGVFYRRRQRRMMMVMIALPSLVLASVVAAMALRERAVYFYPPAELPAASELNGREIRLGGMVVEGSLKPGEGSKVIFAVTDFEKTVTVEYDDLLPPLFGDGQGVIVQGILQDDGLFVASEVMAKHDENYTPPEIADTMEKAKQKAREKKAREKAQNQTE